MVAKNVGFRTFGSVSAKKKVAIVMGPLHQKVPVLVKHGISNSSRHSTILTFEGNIMPLLDGLVQWYWF